MRKTSLIFSTLVLLLAGLLSLTGCTVTECGNGTCESGEDDPTDSLMYCSEDCHECGNGYCDTAYETATSCPEDCAVAVCGNGVCETGETPTSCPADCAAGGASVSFAWYIHHILGGETITFGSGESADDICAIIQAVKEVSVPPIVQLWEDTDNDNTADRRFDFTCSAGQGLTTEEWDAGDTLKFAFALADPSTSPATLLSLSPTWDTVTLHAGENDLGDVDFYVGDYGPLSVDITWADKEGAEAQFLACEALDPTEVSAMGYLLNYSDGSMVDEVDIETDPITCKNNLTWDIIDFDTYSLVVDGEDTLGTTLWGATCENLAVSSRDVGANEYTCTIIMTASP